MNEFAATVDEMSGQKVSRCYQCGKCSAGCPVSEWYEWPNHAIVRKIQYGAARELLDSHALWLCIGCETCGARCPNSINIASLMGAMRKIALSENRKAAEPKVMAFHESFTNSVASHGRVHEATMLAAYKLKSRDFFTDLVPGMRLFFKGKIPIRPSNVKGKGELKDIFADVKGQGS